MMVQQKETPGTFAAAGANQSSVAIIPDDGSDRKAFATLQARAAMRGHTLIKSVPGYFVAKGAHSRHCDDLATVDALLKRMGA